MDLIIELLGREKKPSYLKMRENDARPAIDRFIASMRVKFLPRLPQGGPGFQVSPRGIDASGLVRNTRRV
jgi:hypothetical protein